MEEANNEYSFRSTNEEKFVHNLNLNNNNNNYNERKKVKKEDLCYNSFDKNNNSLEKNISKFSNFNIQNSEKVYWLYHSNFILEEELIKKIFCTWTPFYLDLNLIINESIKQKKEKIILENQYIIDLKHNFFYNIKNPNIRRYICCINLNENINCPIKRIFRSAQNLRVNKLNLLENINGMDKELDWYTEKYSKIDDKKLFKHKDIYEIQTILEKEYAKGKLDLDRKEFDDFMSPIDKKFHLNPYVNYSKRIKLCDILRINYNEDFLLRKKDKYEVSNIDVFRNTQIPKFNNEIFYKEFTIPYWVIDQIDSFKKEFIEENFIYLKNINFFDSNFNSLEDFIKVLKQEFSNQFDLFIEFYARNSNCISNEALRNRKYFSMEFPKSNDLTFHNYGSNNNKKNTQISFKPDLVNKNSNYNDYNRKTSSIIKNENENKSKAQSLNLSDISNSKTKEKVISLQKDLKKLYKRQHELKPFASAYSQVTRKANENKNIQDEKAEQINNNSNISFANNANREKIDDKTILINQNSILNKYRIQKDEYIKILDEINNDNLAEKLLKIFTLEGEIYNIVNAMLKNKDFFSCKIKLYVLLLLSSINNLSKSNTVNVIQKNNLLNIGSLPKNNKIYNLKNEKEENYESTNKNNMLNSNENDDLSSKPQLQINKYLSVLLIQKPKLKLRLFRNFEPSVDFFKRIVYSYKYKQSKDFTNNVFKSQSNSASDKKSFNINQTLYNSNNSNNEDFNKSCISNKNKIPNTSDQNNKNHNKSLISKNHIPNKSSLTKEIYSKENIILSEYYNIKLDKLAELKHLGKDNSGISLMIDDKNIPHDNNGNFNKPLSAYHKSKNEKELSMLKFDRNEILFNKYIRFDEILSAYYNEEKFLYENLLDSKAKFQMVLEFDFDEIIKNSCSLAFIEQFSHFPAEKEVLISPGYVFKIKDIEYVELEKLSLDLNIFEKELFSGKYILTLEYKFNGLDKFEFIYYLNEEILNLNNRKITDEDLILICYILDDLKFTKIKKLYLEENLITEKGFNCLVNFLLKFDENILSMNKQNHKIDSDIMKIDSISLSKNEINSFNGGIIENLFAKCSYVKHIDLSHNPFNKGSNANAEFYNFLN